MTLPYFLAVKVSFRVASEEIKKMPSFRFGGSVFISKEFTVATFRACDIIIKIMVALACPLFKSGISLCGVTESSSHVQVDFLYGLNLKFPTSIPVIFIWESPPPGRENGSYLILLGSVMLKES